MKIDVIESNGLIKIYNCGVLILEENSYNEIVLTIKEALTTIDDLYQIEVLKEILKYIKHNEMAVA
ncbi:hypothetical protein [Clostridium disporicum]|uniref:Uncharacterized protein n=1 Tax=Clostridium disporicum TaxID=84024 RepID=A0A174DMH2_9CLOT|nr:hypothetical protein [Clostridium disporicum]CUO26417.1 Uncharacterised protein [Clostridium disporicum]